MPAGDLWSLFDQDYFLRNSPDVIAWHAAQLLEQRAGELPLIDARKDNDSGTRSILRVRSRFRKTSV